MNIAIVGTGGRCVQILDFFKSNKSGGIGINIQGIADAQRDPNCLLAAKQSGVPVCSDYRAFLAREDINLIIDLSADPDTFQDILANKKKTTRVMDYQTARLFLDMCRIHEQQPSAPDSILRASSIYKTVMNDFIHEDVLVIAANYQILDANDALLKRLGRTREEVIGHSCFEVTHHYTSPCAVENCQCPLKQTMATQKAFTTTHVHLDKEKQEHHVAISCYPLMGPEGLVGAIEISKDITRDIMMQRSLLHQEKLVSIGRLSAGVAHEINNPLTTVLTTAMLLQEDTDPGEALYKELETIIGETMRCRNIVTALLDFARQKTPQAKLCSVNTIVAETVALARKQSAFKDIDLEMSLDETVPPLSLDSHQITQALINLTINAIESTEPGGKISIRTEFDPGKNNVKIHVKDTGAGIPPGLLAHVFEPFFTTKESGTGLGLAITHGIIVQHGGRIEVDSQPDRGTTFTIIFPIDNGAP